MEQVTVIFWYVINFLINLFSVVVLLSIAAFIINKILDKFFYKQNLSKSLKNQNSTYILIKIPPTNERKEDALENFVTSLHHVIPNNSYLSLEMISSDQFLRFYIVVPKSLKTIVESQLYAQYPDADIQEVEDYITDFGNTTAFSQLYFKHSSVYPLNTYHGNGEDLLKNMSAILAKTEKDEKVYIQLALQRVGSKFWERGVNAFLYRMFGKKFDGEGKATFSYQKFSGDLYRGKLRVALTSSNIAVAQTKLTSFIGLFKAVKGGNELKKHKIRYLEFLPNSFKTRLFEHGDLWHPAEIATIYHFPYKGAVVSNIVNTTSKRAPAPDILPREGLVDPLTVSFIGETNYRNDKMKFGLKRFDRRRHLYVVGKTGSGKSRLLQLLLIADIQSGQGCCILDPHGDLADDLLRYVPKERIKDVVYVNPADRDFPIGFNPLEPVEDYEIRQHLSRFFIAIFKKLFAESWNPRMEHLIRYITLALLETPDSNVLGIPRMLSDVNFRQRVIRQIQDPVVKSFWTNEFAASNEQFMDQAAIPIMNKVGQFISNPVIRNMVGQQRNMLDFESFMNEGKIVIINSSKGKLGEENAALLGSMFITKIQQGALARSKIPEEDRRDFYFYVDEFQNFATDAFSSILSEARKYHLDLTIAHQYIAQLPDDVKATAFGNVGSIIAFSIGGDDAAYLSKEFSPVFSPDDMINLNTREMYIKMSIDGKLSPPFSGRTLDVPQATFDYSKEILDNSRMVYGRNRIEVENEIAAWSRTDSVFVSLSLQGKEEFPEPLI